MKQIILTLILILMVSYTYAIDPTDKDFIDIVESIYGKNITFYTLHGTYTIPSYIVIASREDINFWIVIDEKENMLLILRDGYLYEEWFTYLEEYKVGYIGYPYFRFRYYSDCKEVAVTEVVKMSKFRKIYDKEWQRFKKDCLIMEEKK